jgi:hypothetical protein
MSSEYSDEQNQVFIDHMEEYRDLIEGESPKETQRITTSFAGQLIKAVFLLSKRSNNGLAERLVYFDNLLAGVTFPFDYYLGSTYEKHFGKLPRKNKSKVPNNWKTQHEARKEMVFKKKD